MANFFWVGGTGSWSEYATHWATTSGGSTFQGNEPTSADDVFIDANSGFGGGGTLSLVTGVYAPICNNFVCSSGDTYTISGDSLLSVFGSFTLESGITWTSEGGLSFESTTSGNTITTAGVTLGAVGNQCIGIGGVWTLQDNFVMLGDFYMQTGTFDANDHNVTAFTFYFSADLVNIPTVIMGSGTWEVTGNDTAPYPWYIDENEGEVVTIIPETSTIKFTDTTASTKTFGIIGKTYNNIWFSGVSAGEFVISGDNTFADLKIDAGNTVKFLENTTTTLTTFTATGTEGNLITLDSQNGTTQFTLSASSGVINCDYLDISNSNATGGATWYAGSHSADTMNNDGWIFEDEPPTPILGCTDPTATNYDPTATQDDGSCVYAKKGFKTMPQNIGRGRFMSKSI